MKQQFQLNVTSLPTLAWRWWCCCLSVLAIAVAASDYDEQPTAAANNGECTLYVAPSAIPGAGLGLYTAVDLPTGSGVGGDVDDDEDQDGRAIMEEIFIPIIDKFKTLPHRGQQRFLSWLGYVWPRSIDEFQPMTREAYPVIPESYYTKVDEGLTAATGLGFYDGKKRVSAFAPGIASLANSDPESVNIQKRPRFRRDDTLEWLGGATPLHGISFTATQDIAAGSELFLDYGKPWHYGLKKKKDVVTYGDFHFEDHWADRLNGPPQTCETEQEERKLTVQNMDWIQENGMCLDRIVSRPSTLLDGGRGAFAKSHIDKGSVIAPAPLIALKRDDVVIYEADESKTKLRQVLNRDKVVGHELILNYCYGHPDSPLLLAPYSPVVNLINHNGKAPNAELRWSSKFRDPEEWLDLHPLEVLDQSGKLMMEFVALRDIEPGEEIFIDYGASWEEAWNKHIADAQGERGDGNDGYSRAPFRHEIGVPADFYPDAWKHKSTVYELAPLDAPLQPGELVQMRWAHNGKPVCEHAHRVGLPSGFTQSIREYSEEKGIIDRFRRLLYKDELKGEESVTFESPQGDEWFAQRYKNSVWNFNMHYVAAYDEAARKSLFRAFGKAGFDRALESIAKAYGLSNITCFHASYMGVSECDNSFTHTDIFGLDNKAFNIIFPVITVNGTNPELDIQSDDPNVVLSINYETDVAVVMGDWIYHKTSPNDYGESGLMRMVMGTYCAQMDESNAEFLSYIYEGEEPAPFFEQFKLPLKEIHWGEGHKLETL